MAGSPRPDSRHRARESALKVLYEAELAGGDVEAILASWRDVRPSLLDDGTEVVWPVLPPETWAMVETLARGTAAQMGVIDPLIEARAEHWRLARMPVVDRLILRLAVFELMTAPATPRAVVINEALELARTFSSEAAVKFVNGVLDGISHDLEQPASPPDPGEEP
jgi:N utilization substance protein B